MSAHRRRTTIACVVMGSLLVAAWAQVVDAAPAPAMDDRSAAFVLQPTVALATSLNAASTTTTTTALGVPTEGSTFVPIARLGVQFRSLSLLLSASYSTAGVQGKAVETFAHVAAVGEPVVWRSSDERTRMYLLVGIGVVAVAAPVVSSNGSFTTASDTGLDAQIGIGGQYSVSDTLSLGLEAFAQTDVVGDGPYIASATFIALTGTFTTRSSQGGGS